MSKHLKATLGAITLVILYVAFIALIEGTKQFFDNQKLIEQRAQELFQQELQNSQKVVFPDYYAALAMSGLTLLENSEKKEPLENKIGAFEKAVKLNGAHLERGYILVSASVDGGRPLTVFDSFYFGFVKSYSLLGGHLMRNKSLQTPPAASSGQTLLLYSLNSLPYLEGIPYDENRPHKTADLLSEINLKNRVVLKGFLATARIGGKVNFVKIYYECKSGEYCGLN